VDQRQIRERHLLRAADEHAARRAVLGDRSAEAARRAVGVRGLDRVLVGVEAAISISGTARRVVAPLHSVSSRVSSADAPTADTGTLAAPPR